MEIKEEEREVTLKTKVFTWNCPITGEKVSKCQKPRKDIDFLSKEGGEIYKNKKEQERIEQEKKDLQDFKNEHDNFLGAKVVEILPDRDNKYIQGIVIEGKDGKRFELKGEWPNWQRRRA